MYKQRTLKKLFWGALFFSVLYPLTRINPVTAPVALALQGYKSEVVCLFVCFYLEAVLPLSMEDIFSAESIGPSGLFMEQLLPSFWILYSFGLSFMTCHSGRGVQPFL